MPVADVVRDDSAPKSIKHLQFGVLSTQEIIGLSNFHAVDNNLYAINGQDRTPITNGVLDKRLGISDKSSLCSTCGLRLAECVGHFAYIQLVLPVFHMGYFKATITMLQNICKSCSAVLLSNDEKMHFLKLFRKPHLENLRRQKLAKQVNTTCRKAINCPHCDAINGTVKKAGGLKIIHEKWRAKKVAAARQTFEASFVNAIKESADVGKALQRAQQDLNPLRVLQLFKAVSPEDCELLGLDPQVGRPEEFIWSFVPVPPVCIRPSVAQDATMNEDDLTIKLAEIVSANNLLKMSLLAGQAAANLVEQWDFLQTTCALYISADIPAIMLQQNPPNKPVRGLCQRLKGKQGRFRGNLSGKRVDYSGRTVISPDPNLRIDEVAVPELIAKNMTYPERVTDVNVERLRLAVINGSETHPGANYVTTAGSGFKRYLKYAANRKLVADGLRVGDIVERHLVDNDIVLFNRQPSLHKLSIMSHRVKVRPWRTFRFNEFVCNPYNADFDGDEMNLHVPQTEEARTEAAELMSTRFNIVTPRNGEPIIAANQDFITGSFLLTKKDTFFNRHQFVQILNFIGDATIHFDMPPPCIIKPERLWTGKQIFSLLMRPNKSSKVLVNVEGRCTTPGKIRKGYPPDMMENDGYLVIRNSEIMCGVLDKSRIGGGKKDSVYSVLLRDYGPDVAAAAMNATAKLCARFFTNRGFSIGINDVTPGERLRGTKNHLVNKAYARSIELIEQSKQGLLENQPGCNAEQTLEAVISGVLSKVRTEMGEICMTELSPYNAPLIMAVCGSKGSKINVSQMVACVGQQIISGNRVPDGFQNRSLPHFPKNAKDAPSKGFVSNSFYSGLSPSEFIFHACSGREGLVDTAVKTAETGYMQRRLMKALEDLSVRYDGSVRNSVGGVVQFQFGDDNLDPVELEGDIQPIDFVRSWRHIRNIFPQSHQAALTPAQIHSLALRLLDDPRFGVCLDSFVDSLRVFVEEKIVASAESYLKAYKSMDAPPHATLAIIDNKTKVTKQQIEAFFTLCLAKYTRAKVEPGTAVGAIGAQSIGEPGTQMTLKTFHFAGVASMNITLGVPRIKEIINASKAISTPIITAKLVSDVREASARIVKGRIEKTYLRDIASVIAPSLSKNRMFISVHIDMAVIDALKLEISLDMLRDVIYNTPKLRIEDVKVVRRKNRLRVFTESIEEKARAKTPGKYRGVTNHSILLEVYRQLPHIVVKGIMQCSRAVISKNKAGRNQLLVEGQGLQAVMTTDGVVGTQTTSNHIMEVEKVLGIEAARATIISEISHTMGEHGLTVDPRHLGLLGDTMTVKGEVLGITRFGIAKMKDSVLMLASFEKTTDHLFEGAFYSKRDAIHGVSECIIMGNPANSIGTSLPSLVCEPVSLPAPRKLCFEAALR